MEVDHTYEITHCVRGGMVGHECRLTDARAGVPQAEGHYGYERQHKLLMKHKAGLPYAI